MNIDAVGTGGGGMHAAAASPGVAATAPDASASRQVAAAAGAGGGKEDIQQMIDQIQSHIKMMNVSLEFSSYGENGEKIAVVVADKETGEVIREIPTKEIQNLYAKMSEVAGIIFNMQI